MEARAPVLDAAGVSLGSLVIRQLPRGNAVKVAEGGRPLIAEGGTYGFSVDLDQPASSVLLEPGDELFSFDSSACLTGRFQPQQHVGRVRVRVTSLDDGRVGHAELEVAPTKLEFASEYQSMLSDVSSVATEALLQGFAPATLALSKNHHTPPKLLYQQFAFLHARLASRELQDALRIVTANPHRSWVNEHESQPAGRPVPASAHLRRSIARPGQRVSTGGRMRLATVPRTLERTRTEATYDSIPNRFVKYALERWRTIAQQLLDGLAGEGEREPGPVRRGRDVARSLIATINETLATPFFKEVGPLGIFPSSNQVLHKQEGYRQVFHAFALTEVGASLALDWDVDDAFAASQRNVATMYEYWTFLQLVQIVGDLCGEDRTVDALTLASDGLSLGFRQGAKSGLTWETEIGGRRLGVDLFFNRTFRASRTPRADSSWSRDMRPDCSIRVRPRSHVPEVDDGALDVWLHFDAKYRVERARQQFDSQVVEGEAAADEAEKVERLGRSKREDLLKMHAYRDAIRGSAGAYVLFPGDVNAAPFQQYAELLPGLGAFVLRPSDDGRAVGADIVGSFLGEVLAHVSDRVSQHERDRYWRALVRAEPPDRADVRAQLPPLSAPPRDALVVCARLRDRPHADWVLQHRTLDLSAESGLVALSADATELRAEWILLFSDDLLPSMWARSGAWYVQLADNLCALDYPSPAPPAALCAPIEPLVGGPKWIETLDFDRLIQSTARTGLASAPVLTWADLVLSDGDAASPAEHS